MTDHAKRRPLLFSRVDPQDMERIREVADRLYDGNLSLLVRIAVKRFLEQESEKAQEAQEAA